MAPHPQDQVQARSLQDREAFWAQHAKELHWHKAPTRVLAQRTKKLASGASHPHWTWFPDGEISTCYNCVDRHVDAGNGSQTAIIWDSPVTGTKQRISYSELQEEVATFAAVLRSEGVRRGDVVIVYMPMIPAALVAMLAIVRLGAVHAVVFGGFAAASLAQRIESSQPKVVVTASCGIEGAKGPVSYQGFIQGAVSKSSHKPQRVLVWQRPELRWAPLAEDRGERDWQQLAYEARRSRQTAACVAVRSGDPLYIIYTSGTTGLPKGVVREAGGHAVNLLLSIRSVFGLTGPGDVMFCASDVGWVVGHTYIVYAPLLAGAATVLFEGKPIGTPDAGTFWRIVAEHKVNAMFTAPTALRAIRRDDPENKQLRAVGERGGLKQLRALFLAGERSEPSIVQAYQKLLEQHAAPGAQVIDNWWTSEAGSPMTGVALRPSLALAEGAGQRDTPLRMKPGSAGKPLPGFDVRVVDDEGKEVGQGSMGNIVLAAPLAPSGFTTLWKDEERFYKGYLKRFAGRWIDTGDAGMVDEAGFVHVMSRSDDIINVAAHRFSTGAIEQAVASCAAVAECCVVGIPDELKGSLPFSFVTLAAPDHPESAVPDEELFGQVQGLVREQIGAIAQLGGMIQGKGMIPKTRSGKTLRRVLRELLHNGVHGEFDKEVNVPPTVEDAAVVDVARAKVREYFESRGRDRHGSIEARPKL